MTHTEDEVITKLTISLVFDPPTKLKDSDNLPKRVLGSLAIFPCHPATKSEVLVWNGKAWEKLGTEINYMRVADLPSVEGPPDLVFTPLKYMGGEFLLRTVPLLLPLLPFRVQIVITSFFNHLRLWTGVRNSDC